MQLLLKLLILFQEKIISDIIKEMEYGAEPSDSADATSLLEAHQHDHVCI